jgi:pimeloyl-ACP methyl ester carboxylesterase
MRRMFVHDEGTGFPIVWIHGFPLSSAMFEPQTHIEGFRHIRPDLPGFGQTPPRGRDESMQSYARAVLDVMDEKRIDRAVIAGFSMGGYVAMQILRDTPERVAALLLMDTRETADSDEGRAGRYKQIAAVEESGSIASVVDAMLPKMVFSEELQPRVRAIMETSSVDGTIAALKAMATRPDSAETLRNVDVAALVVVGDRDVITPPADAERMVAMIAKAEMAPIARGGHLANFERPMQLNPLITAFLARHVLRPESEA